MGQKAEEGSAESQLSLKRRDNLLVSHSGGEAGMYDSNRRIVYLSMVELCASLRTEANDRQFPFSALEHPWIRFESEKLMLPLIHI
jgi:hypothetical protein